MATVNTTNGTYLASLFNPQVIGEMVSERLIDNIVFAPLARIDTTLEGRAGNTVTLPYFNYIGDSVVVAEGTDIPLKKLTESTKQVTVAKIGNAVQITDEAVLSGYGDPINEAVNQLTVSIASTVDNQLLAALAASTTNVYTPTTTNLSVDDIPTAIALFGEETEGEKAMIVDPDFYAALLNVKSWIPASEIAANMLINGAVGMAYGAQVIVSNRVKTGDNFYIVKPGALALYMKRDTMVETDRDIMNQSTVIAASKLFAPYLYSPKKAITLKKKKPTTGG